MKIFDCFTFFREERLLLFRIKLLWDYVDHFCIVEAAFTHAGHPKQLLLPGIIKNNPWISKKVRVSYIHQFSQELDSWGRENYQRNSLEGLYQDANPDDIIIISDLDEIPHHDWIAQFQSNKYFAQDNTLYHFQQFLTYFRLNFLRISNKNSNDANFLEGFNSPYWYGSVAFKHSSNFKPQAVREMRWPLIQKPATSIILKKGGWHLSYLGNDEDFVSKISSIAEHDLEHVKKAEGLSIDNLLKDRKSPYFPNSSLWCIAPLQMIFSSRASDLITETLSDLVSNDYDDHINLIQRFKQFENMSEHD
jgi:beta-1,4-mannosyl-glycoprotein beta-1,4-N-acetylglucosaminyltransferase